MSGVADDVRTDYEVELYAPGDRPGEDSPALTLGLSELSQVPEPGGQRADPLEGSLVSSPYPVEAVDLDDVLTSEWGTGSRPDMLGRIVRLRRQEDGGAWETLDVGRVNRFEEGGEPGRYTISVTDENWAAREATIFARSASMRFVPYGLAADFGPEDARIQGVGDAALTVTAIDGEAVRLTVAEDPEEKPAPELAEQVLQDVVPPEEIDLSATNTEGNFERMRCHITEDEGGNPVPTPLRVLSIAATSTVRGTDARDVMGTYHPVLNDDAQVIHIWVYWGGHPFTDPGQHAVRGFFDFGDEGLTTSEHWPKHIGGTEGIHLGELVVDVLEGDHGGQEVRLEDSHRSALMDADLPRVWLRKTEKARRQEWLQGNVYPLFLLLPLPHAEDGIKLTRFWLPVDVDLGEVPKLDKSAISEATWENLGREIVNRLEVTWQAIQKDASDNPNADRLETYDQPVEREHDDQSRKLGDHPHELATDLIVSHADAHGFTSWLASELFDLYGDGPVKRRLRASAISAPVETGALRRLDAGSIQAPNPAESARTGERLAWVLSVREEPDRAEVELLDFGPAAIPLAAPDVSVSSPEPGTLDVTVSNLDSDAASVTVEAAHADTDTTPGENGWQHARGLLEAGTHRFVLPEASGGFGHGRVQARAPGRLPSDWSTDSTAHGDVALLESVSALVRLDGTPRFRIEGAGAAQSVRIHYAVFGNEEDRPDDLSDFEDHELTGEDITLDVTVEPGQRVAFEVEPYDGWDSGSEEVDGSAGRSVQGAATWPFIRFPRGEIERDGVRGRQRTRHVTDEGHAGENMRVADALSLHVIANEVLPSGARDGDEVEFSDIGLQFEAPPEIAWIEGGAAVASGLSGQYVHRVRAKNKTASGFDAELRLEELVGALTPQDANFFQTSPGPPWQADNDTNEEAWDEKYTYHYSVSLPEGPSFGTVEFYTNDGGGWELESTRSYSNTDEDNPETWPAETRTIEADGLDAGGNNFGMDATGDASITPNEVTWDEAAEPDSESKTPTGAPDVQFIVIGRQ